MRDVFDNNGNLRVGNGTRNSPGRVVVDFDQSDLQGIALDAAAVAATAGVKLSATKAGDVVFGQATARFSATELVAIGAGTPGTLVPAQGANKIIVPLTVALFSQGGTGLNVTGANPEINYSGDATALTEAIDTDLGEADVDFQVVAALGAITPWDKDTVANKALVLDFDTLSAILTGSIVTSAIGAAAGTGYAAGDTFNIGATGAVGRVLTVNAGVVLTYEIVPGYAGTAATVADEVATTKITGSGDDALTIDVTVVSVTANATVLKVVTKFMVIDIAA